MARKNVCVTIAFISLCIGFGLFLQLDVVHADPLMDREGRTLDVTINGSPTQTIQEKDIVDSAGTEAFTVHWTATKPKGDLCFTIAPRDPRLGDPEKITILIHEIRNDRPFQRWKNYNVIPDPSTDLTAFASKKGFCPKEFTLTERLRYPALPKGDYVMRVAYWGIGNWDRQDILFSVTE